MDAGHKTSSAEFIEWRDDTRSRGVTRAKKPSRRFLTDEEMIGFADVDIPFGGPDERASNKMAALEGSDDETIDKLIERYGVARVLRSIRVACDSRAPSQYDVGATFASLDEGEAWEATAQEIEYLIARIGK